MSEQLGRPVLYGLAWSYLVKLRQSLQLPRSRHALADPEEQEQLKKSAPPAESHGNGLSTCHGGAAGHRRAAHRAQTGAAPSVGTYRPASSADRPGSHLGFSELERGFIVIFMVSYVVATIGVAVATYLVTTQVIGPLHF